MEYVNIGSMRVSKVCAGTMTWGSFVDDEAEVHRQLDAYVRMGVNFIDTAELYPVAWNYGKTTERWVGSWLKARLAEGAVKRSDIYIASKCNMAGVGGTGGGAHGYDTDMLRASCLASIERLHCSYLDLYYLHWPSRDTPLFGCSSFHPNGAHRATPFADRGEASAFEAQVLAVKALLDAGLIKHWGVSNESGFGLTMFCVTADRLGVPRPAACENEYSLVNRTYEADVWEAAYRFGVAGVPYGVLSGGTLTGKYASSSEREEAPAADAAAATEGREEGKKPLAAYRHHLRPEFQPRYYSPLVLQAAELYAELALHHGLTPTELALAWVWQRPCVSSVLLGTTTVLQVEEGISACQRELSDAVLEAVDVLHERTRNPGVYLADKIAFHTTPWLAEEEVAMADEGSPALKRPRPPSPSALQKIAPARASRSN